MRLRSGVHDLPSGLRIPLGNKDEMENEVESERIGQDIPTRKVTLSWSLVLLAILLFIHTLYFDKVTESGNDPSTRSYSRNPN